MKTPQLILASGSPRRAKFMKEMGLQFRVISSDNLFGQKFVQPVAREQSRVDRGILCVQFRMGRVGIHIAGR